MDPEFNRLSTFFKSKFYWTNTHQKLEDALQNKFPNTLVVPMPSNIEKYSSIIENETFKITKNNGNNIKIIEMIVSQCHDNVEKLYNKKLVEEKAFGYVLELSNNNDYRWREHSWGLKNGKIIETTHARGIYVQLNV